MAFNPKSKLPDTPWHVGFVYKDENDPRRHKARCIHLQRNICKCGLCGCYLTHCVGSSHCRYYAEDAVYWRKFLESMKTEEEKNEEAAERRAALYRKEKRDLVQSLLENCTWDQNYCLRPKMTLCPFCREKLKDMKCNYCLARFKVVEHISDEKIRKAAKEGIFLIKR